MTAQIKGHGGGDLALLFCQTVILSNCTLNAVLLLMSWRYSQFGQVSFFWQGVVASAETHNWSKRQIITPSVQLWVAHLWAARAETRKEIRKELADREESCDVLNFGQGMVADCVNSWQLWLPAEDLDKVKPIRILTGMMAETTRPAPTRGATGRWSLLREGGSLPWGCGSRYVAHASRVSHTATYMSAALDELGELLATKIRRAENDKWRSLWRTREEWWVDMIKIHDNNGQISKE